MYKFLVQVLEFLSRKLKLLEIAVVGDKNLPLTGPAIVCFNHTDLLDSLIMILAIKRDLWGLAASNYKYNPFIFVFWLMGKAILIDRGEIDRKALNKALNVLRSGGFLGVSPEGTRSKDGTLKMGKAGVAFLAKAAKSKNLLIVPVGVIGSYGAFKNLFRKTTRVTVVIGEPFMLNLAEGSKEKASSQLVGIVNKQIMPKIAELLTEDMRGEFK
jgi:1-acyl-sn-glycerol-3-phosphate acyltransferase